MLQIKGPPKSFFEEDGNDIDESDHRIPSEVLYMLRSVRYGPMLTFPYLSYPFSFFIMSEKTDRQTRHATPRQDLPYQSLPDYAVPF